jgi:aspartyl-tRNA(Asn)/glutamyl-tRNA(Gln) amidotransferase subunit A
LRTIRDLAKAFRTQSVSPVTVTEETLRRIEGLNPRINCYITVLRDSALSEAEQSEKRFKEGMPCGPMDGVPIAVKDVFYIRGVKCTAGSKILANNIAPYDSSAVRRLKAAGAVLIGTTNLHEFAAGVTNANPHYGPVRNPWDETRVSGGSSGGSAAAVASGMAVGAIGTDTAGSVRIPASLCGVLGLKPTYGRVSRLGVVPLASSFDTVGTLTSCAWDSAVLLQVLAGHSVEDLTTSATEVPDYSSGMGTPFKGARVGIPKVYFHYSNDPSVEQVFDLFIGKAESLGCTVKEADFDGIQEVCGSWLPIRRAEATAFHLKWLESSPSLYGDDVRKSLELGRQVTAVEYVNAQNARPLLMERFASSMRDYDVMAVPTTSIPAPTIGQTSAEINGKQMDVYLALNRLTLPFNVVGFPAISIPAGLAAGLPVGIQLVARPFEEAGLLRFADAFEGKYGPYPDPPLTA